MASIKNLKKDIDYVMSLVISDCLAVIEQNQKVNREAVLDILSETLVEHSKLRDRACCPDGKDNPKLVKQYYKKLAADLLGAADESFKKLSAEVKKVA
jgi:predicted nucleic-acid-binding protein